ncbi:4Fe-4S dicluster domain-containing protein [Thermodesulfobacteriota bacterium]
MREPVSDNQVAKIATWPCAEHFIGIDTDKCNGCGDCVSVCPADVFEVLDEDPNDPFRDELLATIREDKRKKIKYECDPCKPSAGRPVLPCLEACEAGAISHSW